MRPSGENDNAVMSPIYALFATTAMVCERRGVQGCRGVDAFQMKLSHSVLASLANIFLKKTLETVCHSEQHIPLVFDRFFIVVNMEQTPELLRPRAVNPASVQTPGEMNTPPARKSLVAHLGVARTPGRTPVILLPSPAGSKALNYQLASTPCKVVEAPLPTSGDPPSVVTATPSVVPAPLVSAEPSRFIDVSIPQVSTASGVAFFVRSNFAPMAFPRLPIVDHFQFEFKWPDDSSATVHRT
jgi:hypothetical protein